MTDLYIEGNHPDGVRVICKACETVKLADSESEAWDVVENHNEKLHNGEDVAGICEWDVPSTKELINAIPEERRLAVLMDVFGDNE